MATLTPRLLYRTRDSVTSTPAVVDGVLYVGTWDGWFYAFDVGMPASAGVGDPSLEGTPVTTVRPKWERQIDDVNDVAFGRIVSSPTVVDIGDTRAVIFAGGATVYALDARDGSVLAQICLDPRATDRCQGSTRDVEIEASPIVIPRADTLSRHRHRARRAQRSRRWSHRRREAPPGERGRVDVHRRLEVRPGGGRRVLGRRSPDPRQRDRRRVRRRLGNARCRRRRATSSCSARRAAAAVATPRTSPRARRCSPLRSATARCGGASTRRDRGARTPTTTSARRCSCSTSAGRSPPGRRARTAGTTRSTRPPGRSIWSTQVGQPGHLEDGFAIGGVLGSPALGTSAGRPAIFVTTAISTPIAAPLGEGGLRQRRHVAGR